MLSLAVGDNQASILIFKIDADHLYGVKEMMKYDMFVVWRTVAAG